MTRKPVTKRRVREYSSATRDYLRAIAAELARPEPDWRRLADLANEGSGYMAQIASDIEDGLGDNLPDIGA